MAVELLAHWWTESWEMTTRRDVWAERLADGRYQVRWRGGEWRDTDGVCWRDTKRAAWVAVRELIGDGEGWTRTDRADPA